MHKGNKEKGISVYFVVILREMNSDIRLTFLGTGTSQGIPIIGSTHPVCLSQDPRDKRLRTSALIQYNGCSIVVDCGPDFRQQMLRNPIEHLDAVLFTHEHADHTHGLDDLRPFYFKQGALDIYALPRVHASLKERFPYVFAEENRYPGAPELRRHTIDKNQKFELGGKTINPIEAHHNKITVLGFQIEGLVYLTDVKTMDKDQMEQIKGCEVLVVNALRQDPHPSHFNLEEALAFTEEIGAGATYFTHISHLLGFHAEVQRQLPQNVFLAVDNMVVEL